MKKGLIFSLVLVTALTLSLGAILLPMASAVEAQLSDLQWWFDNNGYCINVYTDELPGIEMFESGSYRVTVVDGEHGYMNPTGWYTTTQDWYDLFGPEVLVLQVVVPSPPVPGSGVPAAAISHSSLLSKRFPEAAQACWAWNQVTPVEGITPALEMA